MTDRNSTVYKPLNQDKAKANSTKDLYQPSVCGIGYIGFGDFKATSGNQKTTLYSIWYSMIQRCYLKRPRYAHYADCTVCDEWHNFQNFARWAVANGFQKGLNLDKDLLIKGNKIYSPETCLFLPASLNTLLINCKKRRGQLPVGVDYRPERGKYRAKLNKNKKIVCVGYFKTPIEAFNAYKEAKESHIRCLAEEWKNSISNEAYLALINWNIDISD